MTQSIALRAPEPAPASPGQEPESRPGERVLESFNDGFVDFRGERSGTPLHLEIDLSARFIRLSLQAENSFHLDTVDVFDREGVNVAVGASTLISSVYNGKKCYEGQKAVDGRRGGIGFHTKRERRPWFAIDLGRICNLSEIVVYNRDDKHFYRAYSLKVQVSNDLGSWRTVFDNWRGFRQALAEARSAEERALLHALASDQKPARRHIEILTKEGNHAEAARFLSEINGLTKPYGLAIGPHGSKNFDLLSTAEKGDVLRQTSILLDVLNEQFGVASFISCGTLLGVVRDGALIGHDDDVDICYISAAEDESGVLEERVKLAAFLEERGYTMKPSRCGHYHCTTQDGLCIDIFTGFVEGELCSLDPIARKGIDRSDIVPLTKRTIGTHVLTLPANPDALLALNYGTSWRVPDPFWKLNWARARREFAFLHFA